MPLDEDLKREHIVPDVRSLNRWLVILLCAVVKKQGGNCALTYKEMQSVDKGWALDYRYDDETREVTLSVRVGPYTETYVVGDKGSGGTQPANPRLEAIRQEPRSVTLTDEKLAEMEQELNRQRIAHEMETEGWVENPPR